MSANVRALSVEASVCNASLMAENVVASTVLKGVDDANPITPEPALGAAEVVLVYKLGTGSALYP